MKSRAETRADQGRRRVPGRDGHRRDATGLGPGLAPLGIVVLGLVLYLPGLGAEVLRHPLEAKYALAAREMLRGGPLLVSHLFGAIYPDKPPLYFWATAALGRLGGGEITEVTARLPAVMAALAGLLVTWALGRDLFGPRAGVLAAVVLATGNLFFWYARQGHPDQFLTLFVTVACLGIWRGLAPGRRGAAGWMALAYVAMALGVLSKGLLGLLLPLLAGAAYLAVTGPVRVVPARLRLTAGLGIFLAIVLAWYGPAVARYGTGYLYESLVHQHFVRYARTWAHPAPWYYYLGEFPADFLPWILFLPGAIVLGWRASRAATDRRPFLFPLGWFAAGFVVFTLSSGKRGAYLLPLYPAAALMVAWVWDRALASGTRSRWIGWPLAALCGVAALLALGLALVPRHLMRGRTLPTLIPADPWLTGAAAVAVVAGTSAVWLLWRARRPAAAFAGLAAVQAALLLGVATIRAPRYEARYPVREFAARVRAVVPAGEPVLSLLGDYDYVVAFYLDRPLAPLPGPDGLLAGGRSSAPRYVLIDPAEDALPTPGARPVAETRLGPKPVVLIRLDPDAP